MKGLPRSLARSGLAQVSSMVASIALNDLSINVADGAPGFGTAVIAGLPQGNLLFLGAVGYLQVETADADVTATFTGSFSVGTVATVDGDVADAGEADILPATTLNAATAKVSPVTRAASTDALGGGIIDNTDGSLELNLNLLIDDASISGAATFTANGVLHIAYIRLGDD